MMSEAICQVWLSGIVLQFSGCVVMNQLFADVDFILVLLVFADSILLFLLCYKFCNDLFCELFRVDEFKQTGSSRYW